MCRMHAGLGVAVVWAAGLANPAAAAELLTLHPGNYADFVPAGKEVDAIHGDYVLRNDRIVAVVADPTLTRGRSASRKSAIQPPRGWIGAAEERPKAASSQARDSRRAVAE